MANDLNSVILIGRMTRDPEYKSVNGNSLVNFSLASNRTYVENGNRKDIVNYFDCVLWGKQADIIKQYAGKGKQLLVEGRLEQSTWDAPDGKKMSKIRIRVESFQLLGGKKEESSSGGNNAPKPFDFEAPPYQSESSVHADVIDAEDIF